MTGYGSTDHHDAADENGYTDEDPLLPPSAIPELHHSASRDGAVSAFAAFGLIWVILVAQAVVRWVFSDNFGAPPIDKTDEFPKGNLIALRFFEVSSVFVLLWHVWACILTPMYPGLRRFKLTPERGPLSLDGRHVLGGLLAVFCDGFLNGQKYIFWFNQYSVNLGVWAKFMPLHNPKTSSWYAESILWGMPMYVYFCAGFGIIGTKYVVMLRKRFPSLTNAGTFTLVWIIEYVLDFIIENLAIRITRAYGFGVTYAPLTLFAGKWYQFPLYESACVATLGTFFTVMRVKAYENGISPFERGYHHWPVALQSTVRTLAAIGFCAGSCIFFYHLPLTWFGMAGDSVGDLPSYMRAAPVHA